MTTRFSLAAAVAIVVALLIVLGTEQQSSEAAYPGTNGKIAFVNFDNNNFEIWTMNPDGSSRTQITNTQGETRIWGDHNCTGSANSVDSLLTLRFDAGLSANTGDCPDMGALVDVIVASVHPWGDVDCSGSINPLDSLKLLRNDAGLSVSQTGNCPLIGSEVELAGG